MLRHRASTLIFAGIGITALAACSDLNTHQTAASHPPASGTQYAAATPPPHRELTADMVRQVQQDLQQQGLYKGNVDGVWGVATQTSLKTYQQSHGLNASGEIDSPTLVALNLPANNAPPANTQQTQPQQPEQQAAPADNNPPAANNNNPPANQPAPDNATPPSQ